MLSYISIILQTSFFIYFILIIICLFKNIDIIIIILYILNK